MELDPGSALICVPGGGEGDSKLQPELISISANQSLTRGFVHGRGSSNSRAKKQESESEEDSAARLAKSAASRVCGGRL